MTLHTQLYATPSLEGLSKYGGKNKGRREGQKRDEVGHCDHSSEEQSEFQSGGDNFQDHSKPEQNPGSLLQALTLEWPESPLGGVKKCARKSSAEGP